MPRNNVIAVGGIAALVLATSLLAQAPPAQTPPPAPAGRGARGGAPAPAQPGAPAPGGAQAPGGAAAPAGRGGAQGRGAAAGRGPAATPRQQAPIDLTGYWVSLITEDWRYRMMTAPRGDHPGLPLSAEGNRIANSWDPAKDEAAGDLCKAYGAPGIMRAPGRLHITWDSDTALKMDAEAGTQTRLLKFGAAAATEAASAQGTSVATWEGGARGRGGRGAAPSGGTLKVVTTRMKPGYFQKNGLPYGENATYTEYITRTNETGGDSYMFATVILEDPVYLTQPLIRSLQFKKLPDTAASAWAPEACTAK